MATAIYEALTESEKREIAEVWHTQIETLKDIIGA